MIDPDAPSTMGEVIASLKARQPGYADAVATVDDLVDILRQPELLEQIPEVNRSNFAKHLTITKLKIENAIAIIRAGAPAAEGE